MTRDEIYRKFGPVLLEAVVMVIKDEINALRSLHSLPDRTSQQLINALETKLAGLTNYDWMNNGI